MKNIITILFALVVCCFLSNVTMAQGTLGEYPGAGVGFDSGCGYPDAGNSDPGTTDTGLAGNVCGSAFDVTTGVWVETAGGFDISGFELNNYDIDQEAAYGFRIFFGPQNNCCTVCLDAMLDLTQQPGTACGTFGPQVDLGSFGFPVPANYGLDVFGEEVIPSALMCPNTEYFAQYQFISATAVDLTDPDGNFCAMDDALITNAGTQSTVQTLVTDGTRDALIINSSTLVPAAAADCASTDVLLDFTVDISGGCTALGADRACSQGLEFEFRAALACADGTTLDITTGPLVNDPTGCFVGAQLAGQISLGTAADVCAIFACDPAASLELYTTYTFCEADDIVGDGSGNDEAVLSISIASILTDFDGAMCCNVVPPTCSSTYNYTVPTEVCNGAPIDFTIDAGCDISLNTIDFGGGTMVDPSLDLDIYIYAPGGVAGMAPAGATVIPADIDGGATGNADIAYLGTAGAPTTVGSGCGDFQVPGTLFNGGCAPLVVSFFVVPYSYDFDTDGDGTFGAYLADGNANACPVLQYDVTINPILEIITDTTDGCNQFVGAFVSDGMGGFFDQDGDGALTPADACGTDVLGPACTDGGTLDYDFSALDVGTCSGDLTGTLTCICPPTSCASMYAYTVPTEVCNGAPIDFTIDAGCDITLNTIDFGGGTMVDPSLDLDIYIYAPGGVAGMAPAGTTVIPADIDGGATGNADIAYLGTAGAPTTVGSGCGDFQVPGTLFNGGCAPLVVSFFVVPYSYDFDTDGDGTFGAYLADGNANACPVLQYDVTINPILEIITDTTDGCNQFVGAFVSDGMGGFFDQDGDGALTPADACGTDVLGPACTDGGTLDYDFSALDVGTCSGDLTGTLTCICPPTSCASMYAYTVPTEVCNGAPIDFTIDAGCDITLNTIDFGGGTMVDPSLDLDIYIYAPGGVAGMAPAGTTVIPADIDGGATGNADIAYLGTAGAPTTVGSGCGDFQVPGTLFNGGCAPLVVSFFVVPYSYDFDTDGDGTFGAYLADGNANACPVLQYDVTINPILEIITDTTDGCNQFVGAFVSDGMGGFFDQDGDGALTPADACGTDVLGPACTDGGTLDYDFSALDVGTCSGDLTGTLTCICPTGDCTGTVDYPDLEVCNVTGASVAVFTPVSCTVNPEIANADGTFTLVGFDIYAPDAATGAYLGTLFESATFGAAACGDLTITLPDNLTCDALVYQFEIVTSINEVDAAGTVISFANDPNCTTEIMTVTQYPVLIASAVGADCPGDVVATLTAEDGTVCATDMVTCAADGPVTIDFAVMDPAGCSTLSATADCSNCGMMGVPGCTDPCDPAFDPASTDDTLCQGYDDTCNADCTAGPFGGTWDAATCACINETAPVNGCTDAMADNYDPAANCDDGSCMTAVLCEITATVASIDCDNMGTPEDGSDDTEIVTLTITSTGPWTAGDGTMGVSGDTYTFPATVTGTTVMMMFSVDGETDCNTTFSYIVVGCDTPAIPTLSQWGLMILALLMMTFGALKIGSFTMSSVRKQ